MHEYLGQSRLPGQNYFPQAAFSRLTAFVEITRLVFVENRWRDPMTAFQVNFRPFDEISPNHVVQVDAEHMDDIDIRALGDNIDPSVFNSADWFITSANGSVVLKNSPDTGIDIWR